MIHSKGRWKHSKAPVYISVGIRAGESEAVRYTMRDTRETLLNLCYVIMLGNGAPFFDIRSMKLRTSSGPGRGGTHL